MPENVLVDWDDVYSALSSDLRRALLYELDGAGRPMTVDAVASRLSDRDVGDSDRLDVKAEIVHVHLPKLIHAGLVVHDPETDTVASADLADRIPTEFFAPEAETRRGLLTNVERARLEAGDADADEYRETVARLRERMRDEVAADVRLLAEHRPDVFEQLREIVRRA
ncbi:DUF7344 domain-containing protein [Halogeometricum limi]|uniref:DUF7344 domain-containing protein n=1 Tax=Halogeometricum limi TaxID=555875 RepID=A0A1I6I4T4_9EURY|nr:hypothetical protein [Halogeometricum limi]SFR61644.1 hypothetical protein SAMN04488124_2811 [Halogeometricum limi]